MAANKWKDETNSPIWLGKWEGSFGGEPVKHDDIPDCKYYYFKSP